MKKILFIATTNMHTNNGGGIASNAIYNALSEMYPDKVDVIHPYIDDKEIFPANFSFAPDLTKCQKIINFFNGRIHRYYDYTEHYLNKNGALYSHCFLNTGILGDLIPILKSHGIKVCVIHHNLELEFQMDNKKLNTFGGRCDYFVKRNECKAYLNSDLNLFLTASDKNAFEHIYGCPHASNNYVLGIFEPRDYLLDVKNLPELNPSKLVISGSLNTVQTLCGMKHFRKNCLNQLHEIYNDDFLLTITGRNPDSYIKKMVEFDNCMTLIPSPNDIVKIISGSGIFICPTNVGGGIKLRIIDGLKLGMPIVTHKISARGYDAFWNEPWFKIYDDTSSFSKSITDIIFYLKHNSNVRCKIYNSYKENFSYSSGILRLRTILATFI